MELLVGVGVLVHRDGRVLIGRRRNSHGAASWGLPGGHLEPGETIGACARRKTLEETGLRVDGVSHAGFTGDVFETEGRHYVTLFVEAPCAEGEPALLEPDKCDEWAWAPWDALPEPLFAPLASLRSQGYAPPR